jgi:hypothetical protein
MTRIVYHYWRTGVGWVLLRQLGNNSAFFVMRAGSRVKPAYYPTKSAVLSALRDQNKADTAAATRLGVRIEIVEVYGGP